MKMAEVKKIAEEEGWDFEYVKDRRKDIQEEEGIKLTWEQVAEMILNDDFD